MFDIERLYARYSQAISDGDARAWAGCFTRNGVFSNARGSYSGEQLERYAAGWIGDGGVRYWIGNLVLEAYGAEARGRCYLAIVATGDATKKPDIHLTGVYADALTKRDGGWKFASRHIARDV